MPVAKCSVAAARDLQDLWFSHYFQLTKGVWDGEAGENPALDLMVELESELVGLGRMEPVVTGTGSMLDVPHGRELWGWRMWGPTAAVDAPSVTHWLTQEEHRVLEPQKPLHRRGWMRDLTQTSRKHPWL